MFKTPLFTSIFSFRKRSEWKDKQFSDILINELKESSDSKKVELGWMTPTSLNQQISLKLQTNLIV